MNSSWPIVEQILARRSLYNGVLSIHLDLHGTQFTREYFSELRRRKASIIEWSQSNQPTVVFIGQMHASLAGNRTAQTEALAKTVQDWSFDRLLEQAADAQVITFEQFGTDERMTARVMVDATMDSFKWYARLMGRDPMPRKQVARIFAQDQQASSRAIREAASLPPIYCGEEWPLAVESAVIMRTPKMPQDQLVVARQLVDQFNRLRSEIILIRTLEFLRVNRGRKGVILQGAAHGPQIQAMAAEYHATVTLVMP